jgi:aspartyl-tRNA(Asn)/glutamyl-tRNA(Gln) amidotransferase subunit A
MPVEAHTRRSLLATFAFAASAESLENSSPLAQLSGDPADWTLVEAARALQAKHVSSVELTRACLARTGKVDHALNAYITLDSEAALSQAAVCDRQRHAGQTTSVLHGIPIALKDNIDTAGLRTTAASQVFKDRVPTEDAEVTRRLKAAGMVLLGKLNLDEFAFEGTGTTGFYGPVHNPWKLDRITGGSSAGSAAAVAGGQCFASVGSDDGGSVRIPAAFCGVVGCKTSYGRVSTRGVIPSAYSLDTMGPITRRVEDAALLLQVLAGFDPRDPITANVAVPHYRQALAAPIANLRIGVPRDYFFEGLHPDVAAAVDQAIRLLQGMTNEVREVKLPRFQFVEEGSYDVELLHYQAQFFDRTPELYHPWSRRQLEGLRKVTAVRYVETLKRIREARRDIRSIFEEVDVLLLPTMREPAPLITETVNETHQRSPSNVSAFNRFGTPAVSVPCGFSKEGLPIGLQVVGPPFEEGRILAVAHAFEQATQWHRNRPALLPPA